MAQPSGSERSRLRCGISDVARCPLAALSLLELRLGTVSVSVSHDSWVGWQSSRLRSPAKQLITCHVLPIMKCAAA